MIFADTEKRSGSFEESRGRLGVAGLAACLCAAALLLWAPTAPAATNNVFSVAGTGVPGFSGDGLLATAAQLNQAQGVAETADGGFLVADTQNHRVREVGPGGVINTVAGNGTEGSSGDDGPATDAELALPTGVAAMPDGGFLIADFLGNRVRRVSPAGIITTVAGTDTGGFSGDNGPATEAELSGPLAVAATADGGFLIADTFNYRVRYVSPAGTITTVAGTTQGFSGDDGPATAAQLNEPAGVAATADGGFLIADTLNQRVRRVSPAGIITTVAGDGTEGFSGDGTPATAAQLNHPEAVEPTPDGGVLIGDTENNRVRRVSSTGRITTIAGNGMPGFGGIGGPATQAQMNNPTAVAVTADGGFLIAEVNNNRITYVDADLRFPRGPQGAAGARGPAGPAGARGPAGPAGPAGPVGRAPLALALADSRLRVRARRMVTLRYAATDSASVVVRIMRGQRTIARARGRARDAANRIRIRAPRRAGRYRLRLEASTSDGRAASARAVLIVRRGR